MDYTTNGTNIGECIKYKVGSMIYNNQENALSALLREKGSTSSCPHIIPIKYVEFTT